MSNTTSSAILSIIEGFISGESTSKGGKRIVEARLPDGGFVKLYVGTASAVKTVAPETVTAKAPAKRVKPQAAPVADLGAQLRAMLTPELLAAAMAKIAK